jgi:hypothetical protein
MTKAFAQFFIHWLFLQFITKKAKLVSNMWTEYDNFCEKYFDGMRFSQIRNISRKYLFSRKLLRNYLQDRRKKYTRQNDKIRSFMQKLNYLRQKNCSPKYKKLGVFAKVFVFAQVIAKIFARKEQKIQTSKWQN